MILVSQDSRIVKVFLGFDLIKFFFFFLPKMLTGTAVDGLLVLKIGYVSIAGLLILLHVSFLLKCCTKVFRKKSTLYTKKVHCTQKSIIELWDEENSQIISTIWSSGNLEMFHNLWWLKPFSKYFHGLSYQLPTLLYGSFDWSL